MKSIFASLLFLLVFTACDDDSGAPVIEGELKIMPLGDSRVEGGRPDHESYRYALWKEMVEEGWSMDFVGTRRDGAGYPDYLDQGFDRDHEGTGGAVTADILETVNKITAAAAPDVVLLGIGGNDLLQGLSVDQAIDNVDQIIGVLQGLNDSVTILVEQIPPGRSDIMDASRRTNFEEYNSRIPGLTASRTTASSIVIAVDMSLGWQDTFLADPVHYNEIGAELVANRYFKVMDAVLGQ
ncbi:MAG: GDSL-type esterase/lipase family protein [Bacteroidota bacterium]